MGEGTPEFYFHWSDNARQLDEISCFFTDGESAPDHRFNYNYSTSEIRENELMIKKLLQETDIIGGTNPNREIYDNRSGGFSDLKNVKKKPIFLRFFGRSVV